MLHAAIATAPDRPISTIAAALAGVALSAALIVLTVELIPAPAATLSVAAAVAPPAPPAPPARADTAEPAPDPLMLVFRVGGETYLRLADLEDGDAHDEVLAVPRHGKPRRHHDDGDGVTAAIATVADRDVPVALQRWQGRRVEVDAGCTATVVGFAVVVRRADEPGDARSSHSSVRRALHRDHAVLAARLDRCVGSFARDASPIDG